MSFSPLLATQKEHFVVRVSITINFLAFEYRIVLCCVLVLLAYAIDSNDNSSFVSTHFFAVVLIVVVD